MLLVIVSLRTARLLNGDEGKCNDHVDCQEFWNFSTFIVCIVVCHFHKCSWALFFCVPSTTRKKQESSLRWTLLPNATKTETNDSKTWTIYQSHDISHGWSAFVLSRDEKPRQWYSRLFRHCGIMPCALHRVHPSSRQHTIARTSLDAASSLCLRNTISSRERDNIVNVVPSLFAMVP